MSRTLEQIAQDQVAGVYFRFTPKWPQPAFTEEMCRMFRTWTPTKACWPTALR